MLPAQRRDMGEQFVRHLDTAGAQMPDGAVEIDRVPEGDGCREKGQPGGTMALVLECAVSQFAEAVEEDGAGERRPRPGFPFKVPFRKGRIAWNNPANEGKDQPLRDLCSKRHSISTGRDAKR
ncbi:hypothetical protein C8J40_106255 [Sphingomonas sp. PP-CC-3A-396]|nr:hypothetical protein C8J40_106255 [Sphingomonas sp. PP-CC-3A-396]